MPARAMKPFSEACERNRDPILAVLAPLLADRHSVLEIGSGTGQHAVHFAAHLAHVEWYPSDLPEHHAGIRAWLEQARLVNAHAPIALDVTQDDWPVPPVDAVFSANTAHIMHWPMVQAMFAGVGRLLPPGGVFALYGPFNYGDRYTSDSNARFDASLKARDPGMGIRNFEDLQLLAREAALQLEADFALPANNRLLCWRKAQQT